jgi:hypothetical protein
MTSKLLFAVALAGFAAPSEAGWQNTSWGMTPAQVVAAGKGKIRLSTGTPGDRIKDDPRTVQAEGTYASGDYRFRSTFYFRDGTKLAFVQLRLLNADGGCGTLWADMNNAYGKPFDESETSVTETAIWHDAAKNNRVILFEIGRASCSIDYQPLKDANTSGL